jgi:hypothetical protein
MANAKVGLTSPLHVLHDEQSRLGGCRETMVRLNSQDAGAGMTGQGRKHLPERKQVDHAVTRLGLSDW